MLKEGLMLEEAEPIVWICIILSGNDCVNKEPPKP